MNSVFSPKDFSKRKAFVNFELCYYDTEHKGPHFISQLHNLEIIRDGFFSTFLNHGSTKNITMGQLKTPASVSPDHPP